MFCEKCGQPVKEEALYCEYCGTKIKQEYVELANPPVLWSRPSEIEGEIVQEPQANMQANIGQNPTGQNSLGQSVQDPIYGQPVQNQQFGQPVQNQQFGQSAQNQQFGQPTPEPNQAMQYYDTPIHSPVNNPKQKAPKKKVNVGKIFLITGIVAAVLAVGAFVAYQVIMTPKKRVIVAAANTYNGDDLYDSFVIERTLGVFDILEDIQTNGGIIEETLSAKIDGDKLEQNLKLQKDNKKKIMSLDFGASYDDEEIQMCLIGQEDETYLQLMGEDAYFAIKNENIYSQFEDSPIYEEMDIDTDFDTDFSIDWFSDEVIKYEDGRSYYGLSEESQDKLEEQFYDAMQVNKDGTQDVTIGGKNKKAKKYHVVISEDDLKDLIDTFHDIYMDEIFDVMYAEYPADWRDMLEESLEDSFEEYKDLVEEDLEYDVLIYKNKIAGFILDYSNSGGDYEDELHVEIYNEGGKNILNDLRYEFSLESSGKDSDYHSITYYSIEKETIEEGKNTEEVITISSHEEDDYGDDDDWNWEYNDKVTITTEIEAGTDFSFEIEEDDDYGKETLLYVEGQFDNVKKGKSFEMTVDKVEVEEEELDKLEGSLYMSNSTSGLTPTEVNTKGDILYFFEEDVEDIEDFAEEYFDF